MRLIDADKLIEEIKQEIDMRYMYSPKGFINVINNQPTSFDVDKVVEQLDNLRKEYETEANNINIPPNYTCYYKGHMRGYEHSIDIVKRGGIDDN